jgi:transcriptional regulator with XRE-family HTH domain
MSKRPAFGPRLRALRQQKGLTQTELAEMAQLHPQTLVKLEAGDREPGWSTLLALADALAVNLQAFVDVTPVESGRRGRMWRQRGGSDGGSTEL